jgi:hypothetical protein
VLLHVIAAFTFALAHGVSAGVALRLRGEREVPRVQALLDLSRFAINAIYVSIFVLLIAGVAAAFIAGFWGRGWIWAAIVLLVAMFAAMYARASTWFRELRRAAGQVYETGKVPSRRSRRMPQGSRHSFVKPADGDRGDRVRRTRGDPVADGDETLLARAISDPGRQLLAGTAADWLHLIEGPHGLFDDLAAHLVGECVPDDVPSARGDHHSDVAEHLEVLACCRAAPVDDMCEVAGRERRLAQGANDLDAGRVAECLEQLLHPPLVARRKQALLGGFDRRWV